MNKLSIENIVIEKSNKDIKTGVKYEFTDGINLICGNNEAGKSSLLAFLRQGFFKIKGVDKGKIYFKINKNNEEKHYRTDIQDNRTADLRCKVFDELNTPISYDFIKEVINQKYFEQGFTINLDDLMNIQNKDTEILVNTIKDPSGEKLSCLLEKIRIEAKKILGDNNRLTKETEGILEKITKEDIKINELANIETKYNSSVQEIKEIEDELEVIYKTEEYFNIIEKIKELNDKLLDITEQKNIISLEFNEKLFNNQEKYIKIIQDIGKVEANKKVLEKNKIKKEQKDTKISLDLNILRNEYSINAEKDDIINFKVDYNVLKQLKEIKEKKTELEKELISLNQNKENTEETLLRLKHELLPIENNQIDENYIEKLKDLYQFTDEYLTKLKYLQNKTDDMYKAEKLNAAGIKTSKILFILLILMFLMTIAIAVICFYKHVEEAGIFAVLMSVFIAIGLIAMKISSYSYNQNSEMKHTEEMKESVINALKERLKDYYNEINNVESSYFQTKIESLKSEIQEKIQNAAKINDILLKNKADTEYNKERLNISENKIININKEIDNLDENALNIIKCLDNKISIPISVYIDVVNILENLRENISETDALIDDCEEIERENDKIIGEFNDFVKETELKLPFTENYTENLQRLKTFNETNSGFKNNIDILNSQIENINNQLNMLEQKKTVFKNIDKNLTKEELAELKRDILEKRKNAEFRKHDYEKFEGLNEIKIRKSILLNEYRKKIFTLTKDKMILQIVKTAKERFDKIQPDLKNAQKYLEILTEGKYKKINLEREEIQNSDETITKKWIELSRGTKEQVYLALRLGYASNYTTDKITMSDNGKACLPLIIDDAFVNFDESRTRQGIKCLIEFSKTNQILFFTCHNDVMNRHFKELCSEAGININIINVGIET